MTSLRLLLSMYTYTLERGPITHESHSVAAGIYISWSSVCFILIVTEIVMFSQRNLKPWFEVTSSSIKTALWLVFFLIAIHDAAVYGLAGISLYMYGVFT
jgi:hypothetical protein